MFFYAKTLTKIFGGMINELLRKRRNVKIFIAVFIIAVIGVGGYFIYNKLSTSSINSESKNAIITKILYGDVNLDRKIDKQI